MAGVALERVGDDLQVVGCSEPSFCLDSWSFSELSFLTSASLSKVSKFVGKSPEL